MKTPQAATSGGLEAPRGMASLGGSLRLVLDPGDWDGGRVVLAPGVSGHPGSPHYRDLLPLWRRGAYVPLAFSPAAVEAATTHTLTLTPPA